MLMHGEPDAVHAVRAAPACAAPLGRICSLCSGLLLRELLRTAPEVREQRCVWGLAAGARPLTLAPCL
jgi:hypothetical protein